MSSERDEMLIFADGKGDYYRIPRSVLEQGRVPDNQKAQLEQALDQDDTTGFANDYFLKIQSLSSLKIIGVTPPGSDVALNFTYKAVGTQG
jgi:hypothetical protein